MICFMLSLACTAVEATTDHLSLAMSSRDPEAVITSFIQPNIVLEEMA